MGPSARARRRGDEKPSAGARARLDPRPGLRRRRRRVGRASGCEAKPRGSSLFFLSSVVVHISFILSLFLSFDFSEGRKGAVHNVHQKPFFRRKKFLCRFASDFVASRHTTPNRPTVVFALILSPQLPAACLSPVPTLDPGRASSPCLIPMRWGKGRPAGRRWGLRKPARPPARPPARLGARAGAAAAAAGLSASASSSTSSRRCAATEGRKRQGQRLGMGVDGRSLLVSPPHCHKKPLLLLALQGECVRFSIGPCDLILIIPVARCCCGLRMKDDISSSSRQRSPICPCIYFYFSVFLLLSDCSVFSAPRLLPACSLSYIMTWKRHSSCCSPAQTP
jgi:hypothetical protein